MTSSGGGRCSNQEYRRKDDVIKSRFNSYGYLHWVVRAQMFAVRINRFLVLLGQEADAGK